MTQEQMEAIKVLVDDVECENVSCDLCSRSREECGKEVPEMPMFYAIQIVRNMIEEDKPNDTISN